MSYELQLIDCNCNNCGYLQRDFDKLKLHKDSFKDTGLMDNLQYGRCNKFNKEISFIPNVCQIHTQSCFIHRKDFINEQNNQKQS